MPVTTTAPAPEHPLALTSLEGDELAAGAARRFVRAVLARWAVPGLAGAALDDSALLASELVTNAVVHAGTGVALACRLEPGEPAGEEQSAGPAGPCLVLEVTDRHPARALRAGPAPDGEQSEGGRGLFLVAALAESWGITYRRDSKTVWCRLPLTAAGGQGAGDEVDWDGGDGGGAWDGGAWHGGDGYGGWEGPAGPHGGDGAGPGDGGPQLLAPVPPAAPRHADPDWISRGSLSFLAEASDLLAGQLDEDKIASLAAQLCVPRLADWCAVWLYPQGAAPRLAHVWHRAEHLLDELRAALEKVPPEPGPDDGRPGPRWAEHEEFGAYTVPLTAAGHCHGTLVLGRTGMLGLPDDAAGLVEDFARRVALALGTARQYTRQAMISTVLQRGLLPPAAGRIPGIAHAVVYEPAAGDWVGGDFYDLFPAGDGRWCFALGDVCGSGPEAASLAGIARPVLRLLAREGYGVADVLDRLNRALAEEAATALLAETATWDGGQGRFLSLLYGEVTPYGPRTDGPTGSAGWASGVAGPEVRAARGARCTLASAGHPLPLVLTPDGKVRPAALPQLLLGISDDARYAAQSFDLAPGDVLLCVTDGVTERRTGRRQFDDDDGLAVALRSCLGLDAAGVAEYIRRAVHEFDEAPPADDLALLVLQA